MKLTTRVSIGRGVVCRVVTLFFVLLFALLTGSSPLQAAKTPAPANEDRAPTGVSASDWQSIRAAHEAWKHAIEPTKGGWQARNPAQQWTTTFDGRGFESKPHNAEWMWGLELRSYGAGDERREVKGTPKVKTEGHRLAYHWDDTVQEWYVNDGRGLEHGFSVQERPPGPIDAPLTFVLATRGPLRAAVTGDARAVDYRDASGKTVLTYSGLRVYDADGRELEARFASAKDGVALHVDAKDARYPLLIDPVAQQAYLKVGTPTTTGLVGSNAGDAFGSAVAMAGDTVVVGAPLEDSGTKGVNTLPDHGAINSGAAYIFVRSGTGWVQQAYLKASDTGTRDNFGCSVAVSGDTLVVGAWGGDSSTYGVDDGSGEKSGAYVFTRSGATWTQQARLEVRDSDKFGASVAISGDTIVVCARRGLPGKEPYTSGAAYIFVRSGAVWTQQASLKPNLRSADDFGASVAISGDTVVVGAPREMSTTTGVNSTPNNKSFRVGAAFVFARSGVVWTQQAYLKASTTDHSDKFGCSVAVVGDTVFVGADGEDGGATGMNGPQNNAASDAGAVYIFARSGAVWAQQAYLKASESKASNEFGSCLAASDHALVVGSRTAAYVFARSGAAWVQQAKLPLSDDELPGIVAGFQSVAISGGSLVIGIPGNDSGATGINGSSDVESRDSGAARIFALSGDAAWNEQAFVKISSSSLAGELPEKLRLGYSVSISQDTMIVGALGTKPNYGSTLPPGGRAFIFVRTDKGWLQQAELKPPDGKAGKNYGFGAAVAVEGNTSVVGGDGSVYVFVRSGSTWALQAQLKASNTRAGDGFGDAVSISGDAILVGAPGEASSTTGINTRPNTKARWSGAAYIFVRNASTWTQQAYLKASNAGKGDSFGRSVALSGDTALVGAPHEAGSNGGINSKPNEKAPSAGAAYVFVRSGKKWSQQAYLKSPRPRGGEGTLASGGSYLSEFAQSPPYLGDWFGISVGLSGDTAVVGAPFEDSSSPGVNGKPNAKARDSGAAFVFVRSGKKWTQQAFLKPPNPIHGYATSYSSIDRYFPGGFFGWAVAASGNTILVGAPLQNQKSAVIAGDQFTDFTSPFGSACVFTKSSKTWIQTDYLTGHREAASTIDDLSDNGFRDAFGASLAVSGQTAVIGARGDDRVALDSGAAYVFGGLNAMPVITSSAAATARAGRAFKYQIAATSSATSFAASGLPDGLKCDAKTGLIAGLPKRAGVFRVTISASNVAGSTRSTLVLRVAG